MIRHVHRRQRLTRWHPITLSLGTTAIMIAGLFGNTAARASATTAASREGSSCYPTNTFSLASLSNTFVHGTFRASSEGRGSGTVTEDGGAATVSYEVKEAVTDRNGKATMTGALELSIHETGKPTVHFESHCIAEASIEDDGFGDQIIEAEFEGRVEGGSWSGPAVASIYLSGEVNSKGEGTASSANVSIEKGTTCFEPGQEISVNGASLEHAELQMKPVPGVNTISGAGAVPSQFTPSLHPCDPVFF